MGQVRHLLGEGGGNKRAVAEGVDIAYVEKTAAAGTAGYLLDLLREQRTQVLAVKLCGLQEHDALNRQVHAHADGVCGNDDLGVPLHEFPRLVVADIIGQRAVDDAAGNAMAL